MASRAPSSRRSGPWTRGGRSWLSTTPGGGGGGSGCGACLVHGGPLSAAVDVAAAEALRDELDDTREQLGKVTRERDAAKADAAAAATLRGELASVTEERDAAREELATAATRELAELDTLRAERDAELEAAMATVQELRGELESTKAALEARPRSSSASCSSL